jgi:hypothetical protein
MEEYLAELTRRLTEQLGDRLLAAWVVGSSALGDKGEAAAWAIARLDDPAPVIAALARRVDPSVPAPDPEATVSRARAALT